MAHPVIVHPEPAHGHRRHGVGEVVGGAAADCTAVCCCCPCTVVNLVVLAVYKLPKGLVKKAVNKRRRRLPKNKIDDDVKNDVLLLQTQRTSSFDVIDIAVGTTRLEEFLKNDHDRQKSDDEEELGLEKEMWARFAGTGFWRSDSQRQM